MFSSAFNNHSFVGGGWRRAFQHGRPILSEFDVITKRPPPYIIGADIAQIMLDVCFGPQSYFLCHCVASSSVQCFFVNPLLLCRPTKLDVAKSGLAKKYPQPTTTTPPLPIASLPYRRLIIHLPWPSVLKGVEQELAVGRVLPQVSQLFRT